MFNFCFFKKVTDQLELDLKLLLIEIEVLSSAVFTWYLLLSSFPVLICALITVLFYGHICIILSCVSSVFSQALWVSGTQEPHLDLCISHRTSMAPHR